MAVPWCMTCKCRSRHSFSLLCCVVICVVGYAVSHAASLHFRRALLFSRGDITTFIDRPISAAFLVLTLLLVASIAIPGYIARRRARLAED